MKWKRTVSFELSQISVSSRSGKVTSRCSYSWPSINELSKLHFNIKMELQKYGGKFSLQSRTTPSIYGTHDWRKRIAKCSREFLFEGRVSMKSVVKKYLFHIFTFNNSYVALVFSFSLQRSPCGIVTIFFLLFIMAPVVFLRFSNNNFIIYVHAFTT